MSRTRGNAGSRRHAVIALLAPVALLASGCGGGTPPSLEPQVIPGATVGQYYEVEFTSSGGATVTTSNLPYNGLRMFTGSGRALLFGVPASAGTSTINVTAIVGGPTMFQTPPSTSRTYSLTVGAATGDDSLVVDDSLLRFTTNVPVSESLGDSVHGGMAPYSFGLYCLDRGEVCADPGAADRPPDGISLSADGTLSGVVGPESGTTAYPNQRRYDFIVCVTDASASHACALVEMREQPPASAPAT